MPPASDRSLRNIHLQMVNPPSAKSLGGTRIPAPAPSKTPNRCASASAPLATTRASPRAMPTRTRGMSALAKPPGHRGEQLGTNVRSSPWAHGNADPARGRFGEVRDALVEVHVPALHAAD